MKAHGFEPIFDENSKILILGSFPSVKSRAEGFYYGNKQNRFWRTLSVAFNEKLPETIEEKITLLKNNGIALWDIVIDCEIEGSMDTAIKNPIIADIPKVLENAKIETVICNGKTSYELLNKFYPEIGKIALCLPSTSPVNTRFDMKLWIDAIKISD